jgi:hypothetical protein
MPGEARDVAALREKQPGAVYRVSRDGVAKKLWHSEEDLIYSLAWNEGEKKLIFGTGNQGRLYSLMKDEKVSLVFQKKSEQVYGLFPFHSKIYILSNNPSVLNILYPEQVDSGEYLSRVLDTGAVSSWGRIEWDAETPVGTSLQFETRSGNSSEPSEMWSDWSPPYQKKEGEKVLNPRARYIQFKVMFKSQSAKTSPLLQRVSLFYLQTNVPPLMTEIGLLAPNEVYLKPPEQQEVVWGADVGLTEAPKIRAKGSELALAKKIQRKGFQTVTWDADDENGDDLVFSISIRREDEKEWRPLKEKWTDIIYAFDTVSFPDGVYFLKIVASDAPSNPSGSELKSEKVSRPVVVDNSLPVIKNFQAVREKNALVVTFLAEDSMSYIAEVKYLIRPDDWKSVFPEDGICDSKQESFKIAIPLLPGSDNLITVSVKDSLGNICVYRQTF